MKKIKKLYVLIITVMILAGSIGLFVNHKSFSDNENRYLTRFPKLNMENIKDKTWMKQLHDYVSDHFLMREDLLNIHTNIQMYFGKKEMNGVYIGKNDTLIEKYEGGNLLEIVNSLNNFYSESDLNIQMMIIPDAISINTKVLPKYVDSDAQIQDIRYLEEHLEFETIDVIEAFKEANKIDEVYYRLDHHFTSYGAYNAYLMYCESNGMNPNTKYDIKTVSYGFKGTLYSKVLNDNFKSDKIQIYENDTDVEVNYVYENKKTDTLYEKAHLNKKDKYAMFLDGNHSLIQITNKNINSDKELLIIKDSYANSMIPFLIQHYKTIHVIDPRYYKLSVSEYCKEKNITNVFILYHMNNLVKEQSIFNLK